MVMLVEANKYAEIRSKAIQMAKQGQYRKCEAIRDVFSQAIDVVAVNRVFNSVPFQRQIDRLCLASRGR